MEPLRAALNAAVKQRRISYNPCAGIELEPEEPPEAQRWEDRAMTIRVRSASVGRRTSGSGDGQKRDFRRVAAPSGRTAGGQFLLMARSFA